MSPRPGRGAGELERGAAGSARRRRGGEGKGGPAGCGASRGAGAWGRNDSSSRLASHSVLLPDLVRSTLLLIKARISNLMKTKNFFVGSFRTFY